MWPYQEVRRLAVLTAEEMQYFEENIARIAAIEYCEFKSVSVPVLSLPSKTLQTGLITSSAISRDAWFLTGCARWFVTRYHLGGFPWKLYGKWRAHLKKYWASDWRNHPSIS